MATGTDPKYSRAALITWLTDGLESGRFRAVPIEDSDGNILSVNIILDNAGEFVQPDPRRALPDGGRRQAPGRWRKVRPL